MLKRIIAGCFAIMMVFSLCACNANAKVAMTIGDSEIAAGVYIYYVNLATNDVQTKMTEEEYDGDIWDFIMEDKPAEDWVRDKATQLCLELVASEKEFARRNIQLTEEETDNMDAMFDYYWSYYATSLEAAGISQASYNRVQKYSSGVYEQKILMALYGQDGEQPIPDDELKSYMSENYSRLNHILISSKNEETSEEYDSESDEYRELNRKADELFETVKGSTEEEFIALLKENSADYNATAEDAEEKLKKGMIATLEESGYVTEFENAVKELKSGEIGLVKSEYGWHIIKRYDMWSDEVVQLDDYRTTLVAAMKGDEYKKDLEGWVENERADGGVKPNDSAISRYSPKKVYKKSQQDAKANAA